MKRLFSTFFILFSGFPTFSQETAEEVIYDKKDDHIESFPNRITTRLFYVNTSNSFNLNDKNSKDAIRLVPNKQDRIGASVAFRNISVSFSVAPDFLAENKDNRRSKLFNLNLRAYFGKWMQTLDLYHQKGFFVNYETLSPYYPEMKSFKIGGATSYILNDKFSYRAIVSQDEKQLQNAGSFIPGVVYYYTKLNINMDSFTQEFHLFDIALAPAYYYNLIPAKNLLLSAGVSAGIGLNHSNSEEGSFTSLLTELNLKGSLTYDLSNIYTGLHYSYLFLNHSTDHSTYIKDNIPFLQIFIGYRFKASEKLVRKADKINDKLKIKP
ncbi:DUF4421 domain-containing protein [Sinomicrobium sp. M5D2P17]